MESDLDWDSGSWEVIRAQSDYIEFDWFARDQKGQLAALSSFGVGPSPAVVRASRSDFNVILRVMSMLPERTASLREPNTGLQDTEDWERYARLGLFAYDNARVHSAGSLYRRIARPAAPVLLTALGLAEELSNLIPVLPVAFDESAAIPFTLIPA